MTMSSHLRLTRFAVAGFVSLVACSTVGDNLPTSTGSSIKAPTSANRSLGVTLDPTPELGKLKLCKEGNIGGQFTITRTQFGTPGAGYLFDFLSTANFSIDPGVCLVASEDNGGNLVSSLLKITENSLDLDHIEALRIDQAVDATPTTTTPFSFVNGVTEVTVNSFHGATITFFNVARDEGCTFTQGWYKNPKHVWPAGSIQRGTSFDGGASAINVLNTPPAGNHYYILAHQYLTALLNIQGGASGSDITTALAQAAAYFAVASPANPLPAGYTKASISALATTLDNFNNGITGPGHCDDEVILQ
jgi:hypothetical protein